MLKQTLVIASLLIASSAVAHADPSEPNYQPTSYVEVGGALGIDAGFLPYGAGSLSVGRRVDESPVWFHGGVMLGGGSAGNLGDAFGAILCSAEDDDGGCSDSSQPNATYLFEARAGLELRGCVWNGVACLMAGADVGWVHEGMSSGPALDTAVTIPRVGLDLGGDHLRFRPGVELAFGSNDYRNGAVTAAVAYQW